MSDNNENFMKTPSEASLPSPWLEFANQDGRPFYLNDETHTTSWIDPRNTVISNLHLPLIKMESMESTLTDSILRQNSPHSVISDTTSMCILDDKIRFMTQTIKPTGKVMKEGWLFKQGMLSKLWKKRWFELADYSLFCYNTPNDKQYPKVIPLPSFEVSLPSQEDKIRKRWAFKVVKKGLRTHFLATENEFELQNWIYEIGLACNLQTAPDNISITSERYSELRPRTGSDSLSLTKIQSNCLNVVNFARHDSLRLNNCNDSRNVLSTAADTLSSTPKHKRSSSEYFNEHGKEHRSHNKNASKPSNIDSIDTDSNKVPTQNKIGPFQRSPQKIHKSISSFELYLDHSENNAGELSPSTPNLISTPVTPVIISKYGNLKDSKLDEMNEDSLKHTIKLLVADLQQVTTEKNRYMKKIEKHKFTLKEVKRNMVQIFDNMQHHLAVEQEKFSHAREQYKLLEAKIVKLEASSKIGLDVHTLTPQLITEMSNIHAKLSQVTTIISEIKETTDTGIYRNVINISNSLEVQEKYQLNLSQMNEFLHLMHSKIFNLRNEQEANKSGIHAVSTSINVMQVEKRDLENKLLEQKGSTGTLDSLDSEFDNTQSQIEEKIKIVIFSLREEEKKFEELAGINISLKDKISTLIKQQNRAKALEMKVTSVNELEKFSLPIKISKTITRNMEVLSEIAQRIFKLEEEFYSLSSKSPNGLLPNLIAPAIVHSTTLLTLSKSQLPSYYNLLEISLFSILLQELIEMEMENEERLKQLIQQVKKLQTDYSTKTPQSDDIERIMFPAASSKLVTHLIAYKDFKSMLFL